MSGTDILKQVTRWSGFTASFLTLVLGIIHVCYIKTRIRWPSEDFLYDEENRATWRSPLFTFELETFCDVWTPIFFGVIGSMIHFPMFKCEAICKSFIRFLIFHLIMGLFATIGYRGGLGILFSIVVWFCCLLSLICFLSCDDKANLELSFNCKVRDKGNTGMSFGS